MKTDYQTYALMIGGILMVSPLIFTFFALDHSLLISFIITLGIYAVLSPISIMLMNYLDNGNFFKSIKKTYYEK